MTKKLHDNRKKNTDLSNLIYGKVPPSNQDAEKAILGAIMIERDAFERASELLIPECFYLFAHQSIFTAMQNLSRSGKAIDFITVCAELRSMEKLEDVGGEFYVASLTNNVVSGAHIEHHSRVVYQMFLRREMIRISQETISDAYDEGTDEFELLDLFEKKYQQISMRHAGGTITDLTAPMTERFRRIQQLSIEKQQITGVPAGYYDLDKITHGFQPTDLIILAARPSVGKTALALNIARNAAKISIGEKPPVKVGFFSLEMSKGQLVERLMSAESEIPLDKLMTGNMEAEEMQLLYKNALQPLSQYGIYLDDTAALNVYQLRSKARYMVRKFSVGMIIIDYLQLMTGVEDRKIHNREQEISNISRNLKLLAKELQVPILALSQLSRDLEKRPGQSKTPKLSDLRDSGAIEQDADTVMFIYRPEYHDITSNEHGESTNGETHISIAKHRSGKLAQNDEVIKLRALLHIQKFIPWVGSISNAAKEVLPAGNWRPVDSGSSELPFN